MQHVDNLVNATQIANKLAELRKELFELDPNAREKIVTEVDREVTGAA